jgi:hypothetical protein
MFSILLVEDSDEDYMAFTRALRDTVVTAAIPAEPPSPVITVSAALAFRKPRCENSP